MGFTGKDDSLPLHFDHPNGASKLFYAHTNSSIGCVPPKRFSLSLALRTIKERKKAVYYGSMRDVCPPQIVGTQSASCLVGMMYLMIIGTKSSKLSRCRHIHLRQFCVITV